MTKGIALLVLALSSAAYAAEGEITINGRGDVGAKPDFISVSVVVSSQCYKTVAESGRENTALANKIRAEMEKVVNRDNAKKDEVLVNQGPTQQKVILGAYVNNTQPEICRGWASSSVVEMHLANFSAWPALLESLNKVIDASGDASNNTRTYANISSTIPSLYPETAQKIGDEAALVAYADAERQAQLVKKAYGLCLTGIKSVTPGEGSARAYSDGRESARAASIGSGPQGVELNFGPQYAHRTVTVVYTAVACK